MDAIANFRIKQAMLDLIDEHAARNRHSRSDQLRIIVEDWLMDWTDPDDILDRAKAEPPEMSPAEFEAKWRQFLRRPERVTEIMADAKARARATQLAESTTVPDPFVLSGIEIAAGEPSPQVFIGIELDEGYCEAARQRIEDAGIGDE